MEEKEREGGRDRWKERGGAALMHDASLAAAADNTTFTFSLLVAMNNRGGRREGRPEDWIILNLLTATK